MKRSMVSYWLIGLILAAAIAIAWPGVIGAGERRSKIDIPEGVYIDLDRDFYEALQQGTSGGEKVYSNSMDNEYLRQIAVSTKFAVETNLRILRQQERMIQLLQTLIERSGAR